MSGPGWDNADQCAQMRARVHQLAPTHWAEAFRVATDIPLTWYRVQALAAVAKAAADDQVGAVLEKASSEAGKDTDAYRRIAVLSWVIDAALERERKVFAQQTLRSALAQSDAITPMKSRASALELLLARATKLGEGDARQVGEALLNAAGALAADPEKKWRKWGTSYINRVARTLSQHHRPLAEEILTARYGPKRTAAILKRHGATTGE